MSVPVESVRHVWRPPSDGAPTLLLLHGRGGAETDLVPVADALGDGIGVLAPRGSDAEPSGGWAWFRHVRIGIPVEESLDRRLEELGAWLDAAVAAHGVRTPVVAVGFSNGGMMAGSILSARPDLVGAAALLSSAYPLPPAPSPGRARPAGRASGAGPSCPTRPSTSPS